MKRIITMALALTLGVTAFAQEEYNLYVEATSGETGYELKNMQKITFENGKVVLTKKDGTKTEEAMQNINRMYFSTTPLAIRGVEKDNKQESKDIFDLTGRKVERPTKGIYIINGQKVLVK